MPRIVTAAFVGWLLVLLAQSAIVHAQTDPRILIEAMQANRESINPLECEYSVTNHEAASLRDALEGRMRETADPRYATLHGVLKLRDETILNLYSYRLLNRPGPTAPGHWRLPRLG
jgi:hypothetical protein